MDMPIWCKSSTCQGDPLGRFFSRYNTPRKKAPLTRRHRFFVRPPRDTEEIPPTAYTWSFTVLQIVTEAADSPLSLISNLFALFNESIGILLGFGFPSFNLKPNSAIPSNLN